MKRTAITCPRCGGRSYWQGNPSRPFCSEKCKLVDLGRWSNEEYSIEGERVERSDEDAGDTP